MYQGKWVKFCDWCLTRDTSLFGECVQQLSFNFATDLQTKGTTPSHFGVFIHVTKRFQTVCSLLESLALWSGMFHYSWRALKGLPLSLCPASNKKLTSFKTVFLLALATAMRMRWENFMSIISCSLLGGLGIVFFVLEVVAKTQNLSCRRDLVLNSFPVRQ